jgi:hypothetical protein
MKKMLFAALLGLLALPAAAQNLQPDTSVLAAVWDADSGTYQYCATKGMDNGNAGRNKIPASHAKISTSGSSTTVTSTVSGTGAFTNVAVGDPLFINDDGVMLLRAVTARASADSITINAAVDVTGASFEYRTFACGTADTSGAIPVSGFNSLTFQIDLAQENSASTDYKVECRLFGPGAEWGIIAGPTNDTSTFNDFVTSNIGFDECRVGVAVNTDDGGDTGANAEKYTILLNRRK